jgi:hypothetical protein
MLKIRSKVLLKQIHDERKNKGPYSVYLKMDPEKTFNENLLIRENIEGRIIKVAFKPEGIYLIDNK